MQHSQNSSSSSDGRSLFDFSSLGPPVISPNEIEFGKKIGQGQFGSVYQGYCRGKEVAIKKLFNQDLSPNSLRNFQNEIELCSRIQHPNVVLFMGVCLKRGNFAIVTELMKGDLEMLLHDPSRQFSLAARVRMALDVAQGMNWLHRSRPPIIHRDLKPSNILVDNNDNLKVGDFGLACVRDEAKVRAGSPLWMAPEVISGSPSDIKSDIYSFGLILWEIVTGSRPFPDICNFLQLREAICVRHRRPIIPVGVPTSIRGLIESCWNREPQARPTFDVIIPRLCEGIVDASIEDPHGCEFWKTNFADRKNVLWEEFVSAFSFALLNRVLTLESIEYSCLKLLLAIKIPDETLKTPPEVVSLQLFGYVLTWFGPMFPSELTSSTSSTSSQGSGIKKEQLIESFFLTNIMTAMREKWFFGNATKEEADGCLQTYAKPGQFLVRFGLTSPGTFTLSKMTKNGIMNFRIENKIPGGYLLRIKEKSGFYKDICESGLTLKKFVKKISSHLKLTTACSGRPSAYDRIFSKKSMIRQNSDGYLMDYSL